MKIAAIQVAPSFNQKENIQKCLNYIDLAVEQGGKLILFPELCFSPWVAEIIDKANFKFAVTRESNEIFLFRQKAKENSVVIVLPFFEKDSLTDICYNSAIIIDVDGEIKGLYRKIHLPLIPHWEEKYYFKQGNLGFPVTETSIGKIGIQIGWDIFFPEVSRILTLKGAEIIVSPTASAFSSQPRWLKTITASAIVNTTFICRVNRVGRQRNIDFYGGSFCVMPDGALITEPAGVSEGIVLWSVNLNEIHEIRRLFPFLKDRVEKEYIELIGKSFENIIFGEKNDK
jgi:N-carbamoylputrescine amidase